MGCLPSHLSHVSLLPPPLAPAVEGAAAAAVEGAAAAAGARAGAGVGVGAGERAAALIGLATATLRVRPAPGLASTPVARPDPTPLVLEPARLTHPGFAIPEVETAALPLLDSGARSGVRAGVRRGTDAVWGEGAMRLACDAKVAPPAVAMLPVRQLSLSLSIVAALVPIVECEVMRELLRPPGRQESGGRAPKAPDAHVVGLIPTP